MPPRAKHRLTILVLPAGETSPLPAVDLAERIQVATGIPVVGRESPTPRFHANEQGGFHVRCPTSGAPAARPFAAGLQRWREGGARTAECTCGEPHDLAAFHIAPPAGFSSSWLEFGDVDDAELPAGVVGELEVGWPGFRTVWRRDA